MNSFKKIAIFLIVTLSILIFVSFFLPSQISVKKEGQINKSVKTVFNQINTIKNWEKWSPWFKIDSNTVSKYNEAAYGQGAIYEWKSKNPNIGNGTITITSSIQNESIAARIQFEGAGYSDIYFYFQQIPEGTLLTWNYVTQLNHNPIAKYFGLFIKNMIAPDLEQGIENLKRHCHALPTNDSIKIETVAHEKQFYIAIKDSCSISQIEYLQNKNFEILDKFVKNNNIKLIQNPIVVYYQRKPEKVIFECGRPIDKPVKSSNNIFIKQLPHCLAVIAHFYGEPSKTQIAHETLEQWFENSQKKRMNFIWEEFVENQNSETDSNIVYVKVYYPLEN